MTNFVFENEIAPHKKLKEEVCWLLLFGAGVGGAFIGFAETFGVFFTGVFLGSMSRITLFTVL